MTKYYPMMLNIENKRCVVIGGGNIAYRKVQELLEYGAVVTLVSCEIDERIKELTENNTIRLIGDSYKEMYIQDAFLVIAATNNSNVNNQIFNYCSSKNILVNVIDDPKNCSFIVPAKVRRKDLTIAISTNGKCPNFTRKLREELEQKFDDDYGTFIEILGELREEVLQNIESPAKRKEILDQLTSSNFLLSLKNQSPQCLKVQMQSLIK